jgi:hypothetical protein
VLIEGVAETAGFIAEITDITTEAVNESLTPGGMFSLAGHKIKVAGDNAGCGIYFVSAADPAQRVKASGRLAENTAGRIIGIVPALAAGRWRVEAVTQFSSGGTVTKEPRTIAGPAALTVSP